MHGVKETGKKSQVSMSLLRFWPGCTLLSDVARCTKSSAGGLRDIVPNWWANSSTFQDGHRQQPIRLQKCSIGERSGILDGQESMSQACKQSLEGHALCGLALSCWKMCLECCDRNGNGRGPKIKSTYLCGECVPEDHLGGLAIMGNGTVHHNSLLTGHVVCNSKGWILMLSGHWGSFQKKDSSLKTIFRQSDTFHTCWSKWSLQYWSHVKE